MKSYNVSNQKRLIVLLITVGILIIALSAFSIAEQYILPDLQITAVNFSESKGANISGSVEIHNLSEFYANDLSYITYLVKGADPSKWELVNRTEAKDIEIRPNGLQLFNFTHPKPKNLSTDKYFLLTRVYNRTGVTLAQNFSELGNFTGNEYFLSLVVGSEKFEKDGEQIIPATGPNYEQGESPDIVISYTNTYSEIMKVYPQINVYSRHYTFNDKPINVVEENEIIEFQPNETKKVSLKLPAQAIPESYLAVLTMVDEKGNQAAGISEFRYVVKGVSAKIISANSFYDKAKSSVVTSATIYGPADRTELDGVEAIVQVYDKNANRLIKEYAEKFKLGDSGKIISVNIDINQEIPEDIRVVTVVKYNKMVLDSYTSDIPGEYLTEKASKPIEALSDVVGTTYEDAVLKLMQKGVVDGYEDGTFKPERNITRAEFTKLVVGMLGLKPEGDTSSSIFNDTIGHWAAGYIEIAAKNNLVQGYGNGEFGPQNNVTYAEAVTILIRAMGMSNGVEGIGEWPKNYLDKSKSIGLESDVSISDHSEKAVRGNVAKLMWKAIQLNVSSSK